MGPTAILGVVVLAVIFAAPLINDAYLAGYQADAVERGGMFTIFYAALFLASYYVGQRLDLARRVIGLVIGLTAVQALLAIYEHFTSAYITQVWPFLSLGFLDFDPGLGGRTFVFGTFRAGGFRPAATAPHPLVLSALIGLGLLLAIAFFAGAKKRSVRIWLGAAILLDVYALLIGHTRTGILIAGVGGIVAVAFAFRKAPREIVSVVLAGVIGLQVAVLAAPKSARVTLNLFTRISGDTSFQGRLQDYSYVPILISRHPILGLGYFTHSPRVLLLDNSYFGTLIELGVVGGLLVFAFFIALTLKPIHSFGEASRQDAAVLLSGILAGMSLLLGMATFDAVKFAQFMPTILVILALASARVDVHARHRMIRRKEARAAASAAADHHSSSA